MFKKKPIIRRFVSSIDKALQQFNRTHTWSKAQQEEVDKYTRIYQLRDHKEKPVKPAQDLWDFDKQA